VAVGARGLAGVHKRSEEIAAERKTFGLQRRTFEFRWDGNKPRMENAIELRILGDDIMIATQMHRFVPLGDNKYFNGVCRKAFPISEPPPATPAFCYVCDVRAKEFEGDAKEKRRAGLTPTDVCVALAVEMVESSKNHYKPKMIEWTIPEITDEEKKGEATAEAKEYRKLLDGLGKPGAKIMVPAIGLMIGTMSGQQGLFDYAMRRDTVSDRVFSISRDGKGLETKWDWNHNGEDRDNTDPSELLASLAQYPFELPEEWAHRNGSEDRYNHFFKLGEPAEAVTEAVAPAQRVSDDPAPVAVASSARQALMDRLAKK
jgi:hypothetical protein